MKFSLQNVPVLKCRGNNLARSKRSPMYLRALLESIRQHGILQPILVCIDGDFYRVVAGFGRLECAQQLGLEDLPAQVYEGKLSDADILILASQENNNREGTSFLDQADTLERLLKAKKGLTETEAGKLLGLNQSVTSKIMSANCRLAEDVKLKLSEEGIGYSIAYTLSRADHDRQRELLRTMLASKWTRSDLEKAMKPDATRSLSYSKGVKIQVSVPKAAGYEELKEALRNLMNEIAKWEKQNVAFDILPRMLT